MPSSHEGVDILQPLLDNHLAFIAHHRGEVHYQESAIVVLGDADFLSCWIPTDDSAIVPDAVHTVRTVPWSGRVWPAQLHAYGFEPAEVLHYMEAPVRQELLSNTARGVIDAEVIQVASRDDAFAFADAQAGGFLEQSDEHSAWWRLTFEQMALKNYTDSAQFFYFIRAEGVPAAVALGLRTDKVFGIYAVATRPEFRGRGFSSALLARLQDRAIEGGSDRLALQVVAGSYAEQLYRKLGFQVAFRSPAYRRSP
jgi:GNAT superfamily N-acetyltransferase